MTERRVTFRTAIGLALAAEMENDPRVFLLGEDIADPLGGSFRVTLGLSARFGTDRVRSTPISESAIVGAAAGAAMLGLRPVAEIMYADFLTLAIDQLVHNAAFLNYMSGGQVSVPMVVRAQGGAGGSQGAQHSKSLEAWLAHVPGLRVVLPSTPADAYWLLRDAIRDDHPVVFIESSALYDRAGPLDPETPPADLRGATVRRTGHHATLVAWGATVPLALEAAERLGEERISIEVLDVRHISPLPIADILQSVERTGLLAIVHEAWHTGGFGGEIAACVAEQGFDALEGPIHRIGAVDVPHPFSPVLERAVIPSVDRIVESVRSWFVA